jgi:hypothetical protein
MNKQIAAAITVVLLLIIAILTFLSNKPMSVGVYKKSEIPTPTDSPLPPYIRSAAPEKVISMEEYAQSTESLMAMARGIRVTVWSDLAGISIDNSNPKIIKDRVVLWVNGDIVSNDTLKIADGLMEGTGPYYLSWTPDLEPGLQEIRFQIRNDQGNFLEHQWFFLLTR